MVCVVKFRRTGQGHQGHQSDQGHQGHRQCRARSRRARRSRRRSSPSDTGERRTECARGERRTRSRARRARRRGPQGGPVASHARETGSHAQRLTRRSDHHSPHSTRWRGRRGRPQSTTAQLLRATHPAAARSSSKFHRSPHPAAARGAPTDARGRQSWWPVQWASSHERASEHGRPADRWSVASRRRVLVVSSRRPDQRGSRRGRQSKRRSGSRRWRAPRIAAKGHPAPSSQRRRARAHPDDHLAAEQRPGARGRDHHRARLDRQRRRPQTQSQRGRHYPVPLLAGRDRLGRAEPVRRHDRALRRRSRSGGSPGGPR